MNQIKKEVSAMYRRIAPLLLSLLALSVILAGCSGNTNTGSTASPAASAAASSTPAASTSPAASASAAVSAPPTVAPSPDGFVMGKVTSVSGSTITLTTVNPAGTKTITAGAFTTYSVSGSTKTATADDIKVGDVITASLNGTTAVKIIDNGPNINPDPSAYVSPSPSPSPSASAAASPSK